MQRKALSLITLLMLLAIASSSLALAAQEAPDAWQAKVDPWVLATAHRARPSSWSSSPSRPTSEAAELATKEEKGELRLRALPRRPSAPRARSWPPCKRGVETGPTGSPT